MDWWKDFPECQLLKDIYGISELLFQCDFLSAVNQFEFIEIQPKFIRLALIVYILLFLFEKRCLLRANANPLRISRYIASILHEENLSDNINCFSWFRNANHWLISRLIGLISFKYFNDPQVDGNDDSSKSFASFHPYKSRPLLFYLGLTYHFLCQYCS
jgi:hypothetical protein